MPADVAADYKNPLDLLRLIGRFSDADRRLVLDGFIELLGRKLGIAEVPTRAGVRWQKAHHRARRYKDVRMGIGFLLDAPDYGGRSQTLPILAEACEPVFQRAIRNQAWYSELDVTRWQFMVEDVIGPRQVRWVKTQLSRMAMASLPPGVRLEPILPLASYLLDCSEREAARRQGSPVDWDASSARERLVRVLDDGSYVGLLPDSALIFGWSAVYAEDPRFTISFTAERAVSSMRESERLRYPPYDRAQKLVLDLVHPSLLDAPLPTNE